MYVRRLECNPIIVPDMDGRMGANINGPSLIRAPDWLPGRLGRYYLYFAAHKGTYIRLAYADRLEGPWRTYVPGVLDLADSHFTNHIASPDVHVDQHRRELRMYYHGSPGPGQLSRVAISGDALRFTARPEPLGNPYFRVWQYGGWHYALGMPGVLYRSADGLTGFQQGPTLFTTDMRHSAVKLDGHTLTVFYTNAGDCPERILVSRIDLRDDWMSWRHTPPEMLLEPQTDYEGADLPLESSRRGAIFRRARQLRDPAVCRQDDQTYLLYAVAGESGIAVAEIIE